MLTCFLWILFAGFFAGQLTAKLKAPPLIGMILSGVAMGPMGLNVLTPDFLAQADALRTIAVMVILTKAGLGLDRDKLKQQGTVALRLGCLPAVCEALVIAIAAPLFFPLNNATGLLLGCVLAAESPAVIVPGMLWLKQQGWGTKKGIPDAILTGSALSDVLILLMFNLVLSQLTQTSNAFSWMGIELSPILLLPVQVIGQIVGGVVIGVIAAKGLNIILRSNLWVQTLTQATLVAACLALLLVITAIQLPLFSGYLAVMTLGFLLSEYNPPQARRLRQGFSGLWAIAQIILFVLLGASIQLNILEQTLFPGLLLLMLGTGLGRGLGWFLSTFRSNWTRSERLYLLAGNSAKATVQAAIGAIPLAMGLPGGEVILALSALSILVTAPLGAWAIPFFAPKLLSQDEVDPTKVLHDQRLHLLVGVDQSPEAASVLRYAAHLARCCDGRISLLHLPSQKISVQDNSTPPLPLASLVAQKLADIPYQWLHPEERSPEHLFAITLGLEIDQLILGASQGKLAELFRRDGSIPTLIVPAQAHTSYSSK